MKTDRLHYVVRGKNFPIAITCLVIVAGLLGVGVVDAQLASQQAEEALRELRGIRLDLDTAIEAGGLDVDLGLATLHVKEGRFFGTSTPSGMRSPEIVFLGEALLSMEPPNEVEAGQLELFTGQRSLRETVTEAVLVFGNDRIVDELLSRTPATTSADETSRAEAYYTLWRKSPERRGLNLDSALLQAALDEPSSDEYVAAQFTGEVLGKFHYTIDPHESEPTSLGQFVQEELSAREQRRTSRQLHKQQRKGRLIGLEIEDLGRWNTWVSASKVNSDGVWSQGKPSFQAVRYDLKARLSSSQLDLTGSARVEISALRGGQRFVIFTLDSDLRVSEVRDSAGTSLFHHRSGSELLVYLEAAPEVGERFIVGVDYRGSIVDKFRRKSAVLTSTLGWHPRVGAVESATYEVELRWPKSFELMASGVRVDSGVDRDERWELRRIDHPTFGFSFELGQFRITEETAGLDDHVTVTLAVDELSYPILAGNLARIMQSITTSLTYFERRFGRYPLDHLTVVTVPRTFSQAMLGFVTLGSPMISENALVREQFGDEDFRVVIAHEIAHQWWGHMVGWESYRDQWISEALASYSAALYARHWLGSDLDPNRALTAGWQEILGRTLDDGRSIEQLGPLVLGQRLSSTKSDIGYHAITYLKGTLVLEMLARTIGENRTTHLLRSLVQKVSGQHISTERFVDLIEELGALDLQPFAQQYLYSTGVPEVEYEYAVERLANGNWELKGEAHQYPPMRFRYQYVKVPEGGLDVFPVVDTASAHSPSRVVVPVEIAYFDPNLKAQGPKLKKRDRNRWNDPEIVGNRLASSELILLGETTPFTFELETEPKYLFLDRGHEVFSIFYSRDLEPKQSLYRQGVRLRVNGQPLEALAALDQALKEKIVEGPAYNEPLDESERAKLFQRLQTLIHLERARAFLRRDELSEAQTALTAVERTTDREDLGGLRADLDILRARVALREGDSKTALRILSEADRLHGIRDIERRAVLAIAAKLESEQEMLKETLATLSNTGLDFSLLDDL